MAVIHRIIDKEICANPCSTAFNIILNLNLETIFNRISFLNILYTNKAISPEIIVIKCMIITDPAIYKILHDTFY